MERSLTAPIPRRYSMIGPLQLLILALCIGISLYQLRPPVAQPLDAPAAAFSSARAMTHIVAIAQEPRPIGSQAHDRIRDYIIGELGRLGLKPEVQKATVLTTLLGSPLRAGSVQNIVARVEGTNSSKGILLAGHYDSVNTGPGASDSGATVAAMLETARALRANPPLKNDVIFLFTDGEEEGLLGSKAFVDEHPLAKQIGLAMNFEERGTSGPSLLFETSSANGWLIDQFAQVAPHPFASSLFYEVYRILPVRTDFVTFREAGYDGLSFAYIDSYPNYHSVLDDISNVDEGSMQHHGIYMLALARHFGNLDLTQIRSNDAIYFDIWGLFLVHYPATWGTFLSILVVVLYVAVVGLGLRLRRLTLRGLALGLLAFLGALILAPLIVTLIWRAIVMLHSQYMWMHRGEPYNSIFYRVALVALAIAVVSLLYMWLHQRISLPDLMMGALTWWLLLLVAATIFAPTASYLFMWPLLASLIGLAIFFSSKQPDVPGRYLALALSAIFGIVLVVPIISLLFTALTLQLAGAPIVLLVLLLGLLCPLITLITSANRRLVHGSLLLISAAFLVGGSLTAGFDKQHPKPNSVFYGLDADSGQAIWASTDIGIASGPSSSLRLQ
jgi:hypothetical protein